MKRGIVMSIHKQHAVVMTADGQFLRAPAAGNIRIGEEISFDEEYKQPRRPFRKPYRYLSAAAIVLLFMLPLLFYMGRDAEPVVAYLSMDINPSIEIGVDSRERTRELRALNEAGELLIAGLDYEGLYVQDVAAAIVERAQLNHYFDLSAQDVFIASVLLGEKTEALLQFESILTKKVDETVKELLAGFQNGSGGANVTTLSVPFEVRNAADANGISAGKMTVYLMAKDEGYALELEQLKSQSIDEATESLGGLKAIVSNAASQNEEKLKQLATEEVKKQEAKQAQKQQQTLVQEKTAQEKENKNTNNNEIEKNKQDKAQNKQDRDRNKQYWGPNKQDRENNKQNKEEQKKAKEDRKKDKEQQNKLKKYEEQWERNQRNNQGNNRNQAETQVKADSRPATQTDAKQSGKSEKEKNSGQSNVREDGKRTKGDQKQEQKNGRGGKEQSREKWSNERSGDRGNQQSKQDKNGKQGNGENRR
jgi:hypothetical protein